MKRILILSIILFGAGILKAQDFQVSQYYATPMYLNPAFAGETPMARASLLGRLQWPSNAARYRSTVLAFDHNLPQIRSGAGIMFTRDAAGSASLATNSINGMYSYKMNLNKKWSTRVGLQVGYNWMDIDQSALTFRDQLNPDGSVSGTTSQTIPFSTKNFFDVTAGALFFTKDLWIGGSFRHLNRPNMSLINGEDSNLPIYYSIHGGYQFQLYPGGRYRGDAMTSYFSPTFHYKRQGDFQQLDLGAYFHYEWFTAGMWYRGLPVFKVDDNISITNHDALIFLAGFHLNGLSMAYSYDVTLSRLQVLNTGGAHELTLIYEFSYNLYASGKPKPRWRSIPCPRF